MANETDVNDMVELDRMCFGNYGSKADYFIKKLKCKPGGIVVSFDKKRIMTGFSVFEILEKGVTPEDFCEMRTTTPIKGKWVHMVAFTTKSKYLDKESDSKLLQATEEKAKELGCVESLVPLSKDHPFKRNGVFDFWYTNGYRKAGEIKWAAGVSELIECFLFRKPL